MSDIAACAHSRVLYHRIKSAKGCSDLWLCTDCGKKFWPERAGYIWTKLGSESREPSPRLSHAHDEAKAVILSSAHPPIELQARESWVKYSRDVLESDGEINIEDEITIQFAALFAESHSRQLWLEAADEVSTALGRYATTGNGEYWLSEVKKWLRAKAEAK